MSDNNVISPFGFSLIEGDEADWPKDDNAGKFEGFVVPAKRSNHNFPDPIDRVIWLELGFDTQGQESVLFEYKLKNTDITPPGDRNELKDRLIESRGTNNRRPPKSPPSKGNKETILSVNGKERLLVILEVNEKSNLRFNRDGAAISTRKKFLKFFEEAGVFNQKTQSVEQYSQVAFFSNQQKNPENLDCRTAYFIVDAKQKITNIGGDDPSPFPFNIHLDMNGPIKQRQAGENNYYFPVIIDPNVRHPGGTGDN